MTKKFFVAALFFFAGAGLCEQSEKNDDHIAEIEEYLNDITTFESDFVQIDKNGRSSAGRLFIKRPFLMKMVYKQPPTYVVIAKKNKITHYDRELKEKTETSMHSSPLSFFFGRKINLRANLKILSVQDDDDDMLTVKFCKKNEDEEGAVALVFSKNPLALRKWIVYPDKNDESSSGTVEVSLLNWKTQHSIPNDEFEKYF
jgi:outer membrane lipoprotein-sorting protein